MAQFVATGTGGKLSAWSQNKFQSQLARTLWPSALKFQFAPTSWRWGLKMQSLALLSDAVQGAQGGVQESAFTTCYK